MLKETKKQEIPVKLLSKDKKVNDTLFKQHYRKQAAHHRNKLDLLLHNFTPGYLEPEYEGDHTVKVKQSEILSSVNVQTAAHAFDLQLNMGNYRSTYSRNGSTLLLTSSQGHCALLNWRDKDLNMQINLRQEIGEATFLHNQEMFALCQPKNTFIYDGKGIELHKLPESLGVQYLPYHFLLTLYDNRRLKYYDTTTGHVVADHIARNNYTFMTQNKSNAIIAMGTSKGVVEWWTPGIGTAAIQLFVGSKVDGIAFHKGYMYTIADSLKVWDGRTLKLLVEQPLMRRAKNIVTSDSGLVGVNYGYKVEFFKDLHVEKQTHPYLRHETAGKHNVNNLAFVPFQDLVGMGTNKGFTSIIVPGSGVPFYDTFQNNPFESKKQKRQALVHKLLQKLPPETITVDPNVLGSMSRLTKQQIEADQKAQTEKKQREHMQKVLSSKKKNRISKVNKKEIEIDKIKRAELTKLINSKMWAKRAQRKKREGEMELIEQMQSQGLGVADLLKKKGKPQAQVDQIEEEQD